ncbi:hypothetical protein HDA32_001580 [Spinactinospora alkalitolerans]|uniref:Uncharacterized protein n=1 Tax=Spinactinospora alkalitolerans TaxID=687207 RepID=A0A852TX75_9ACTN|nr:hypothetical protein [Spinactinospora alkalitolerans]NYE46460.1 hypothetical protein [Spinactinospora alkalitolerans]
MSTDDAPTDDERFVTSLRGPDPLLEPPPEEVGAAARTAYAARRADALVADVHGDSAEDPPAGLRAAAGPLDVAADPRLLVFRAAGVAVSLEITCHGDLRDIAGQIAPPGASAVEVRWARGHCGGEVDAAGAFVVRDVPRGPISVLCHRPGATPIATRWIAV